jgi:hypothetical protein
MDPYSEGKREGAKIAIAFMKAYPNAKDMDTDDIVDAAFDLDRDAKEASL